MSSKYNKIVSIGKGLCRIVVRSEKLARRLGRIPGVAIRQDEMEEIGWWVLFSEELRPIIEPVFERDDRRHRVVQGSEMRLVQTSLLDQLGEDDNERSDEDHPTARDDSD